MKKLISVIIAGIFIYLGAVPFSGNFLMWVFFILGLLILVGAFSKKSGTT